MLDNAMLEQLKSVYSALEGKITLVYDNSSHAKQSELVEMLEAVASTSDKIEARSSGADSKNPHFHIEHNDKPNGISFTGIPGGHEFTSLILAILNSDGKGKQPDQLILNRVKAIKGPVKLRTIMSLSCENCPDVVQALNLMAIHHENFQHETVDGGYIQEEIDKLGVQGVPSVIKDDNMIHSGKTNFGQLLEKLEKEYGAGEISQEAVDLGDYDVVVLGAGPAGVSSAIYTVRKGLKTAIIGEVVGGQMQDTKGIENFISVPYTEGPELSAALAKHLESYDIDLYEHRLVTEVENAEVKKLKLNTGESIRTKALIVATGAKWRELGVPGEKDHLGRGVAYCPHCDGPYYKGKDIAVVGGGNSGVEAAIDLAGIVKSVTVFEYNDTLKADAVLVAKLESLPNARIVKNARTHEVIGDGSKVSALRYEDRSTGDLVTHELDGVFVQIGLIPNSGFLGDLVEKNRFGEIVVDAKCKTNVKGIYAAGDVTTVPYKQIVVAVGEGAKAGLSAFEDQMISG